MAEIDNLNFKVLLDYTQFDLQARRIETLAKQLNTNVSKVLDLRNKAVAVQKAENAQTQVAIDGKKEFEAAQRRIAENLKREAELAQRAGQTQVEWEQRKKELAERDIENKKKMNDLVKQGTANQQKQTEEVKRTATAAINYRSVLSTISQLTGIYFGLSTIRRFVSSMIEITGEFQSQKVAMATILRDSEQAERVFQQLYEFSSESVYRFSELTKYAKQLAAFQIGGDDLLDQTKMLGDVAAGLGISMDRLILAYGHVKSSGFLRGIQLRSLTQNGVPILQHLSDILTEIEGKTVSIGDVYDRMAKRQITFEMVEEAFHRMTEAGGQFYEMQAKQAETLKGQINILKGRWENLKYAMGEQTSGFTMSIVRGISESISSLDKFKETLRTVWDAGSPIWQLVSAFQALANRIDRAREAADMLAGGGGRAFTEGGDGGYGGGVGGGARGGTTTTDYDFRSILSELRAYDREIAELRQKALAGAITSVEKQTLLNLIEERSQLANEYRTIMGENYDKYLSGAESASEKAEKERLEELDEIIKDVDKSINDEIERSTKELEDDLKKRFKALAEWDEFVEKWEATKGAKEGSGAAFKLSGYFSDWRKEDYQNLTTFRELLEDVRLVFGESSNTYEKAKRIMTEWREEAERTSEATFTEKVRSLADDIFKEATASLDLTNWAHKSLREIKNIKETLAGIEIPQEIRDMLQKDPKALEALTEALAALVGGKKDQAEEQEGEKRIQNLQKASRAVGELAKNVKDFADSNGSEVLRQIADGLSYIADAAQGALTALARGDTNGAIASVAASFASFIIGKFKEAAEVTKRAEEAAVNYRVAIERLAVSSKDTIFGSNGAAKLREYTRIMDNYRQKLSAVERELRAVAQVFPKAFGMYFGDDGALDIERLRADLDAGVLVSDELSRVISQLDEAEDGINSIAESLVGGVVDDLTSKIVDSWWEAGEAALDYADTLGDVAKAYARLITSDLLLEAAFGEDKRAAFLEAIKGGRVGEAMEVLSQAMEDTVNLLPAINQALSVLEPYRVAAGGGESNSLGAGIKSITEDTASLLASYINAIRADVSAMRLLQEKGSSSLETIAGVVTPKLSEYLQQIAANTANSAQHTNDILNELRSVIGTRGSEGLVIRVDYQ